MTFKENLAKTKEILLAYWRQGLRELSNAFYGAGTAATNPEYGTIATKLPSEIAKGMTMSNEQEPTNSDQQLSPLEQAIERVPEIETPEPELQQELDLQED